ncbi:MAG: hypothetical protein WCF84_18850 [Anaerolineae bacterium]
MKSKIGLHINGLWDGVDAWVMQARPQVVVSIDHNPDHWQGLCALSPNTFIIGRHMGFDDGDSAVYPSDGDTPESSARKAEVFFNSMKPDVDKMKGLYDAWVGINEPVCHTDDHAKNLAAWYARWGDLMKSTGVYSVAYTFSQGVPEDSHWALLADGLGHCDLLGLHEYWCPHLYSTNPDQVPYHALRYRTAWSKLPPEARRKIVITECGADGGAAGQQTDGWIGLHLSEQAYLADLQAYDAELQKDNYVIGATIFSAGAGWAHWDVTNARSIPVYIGSTGDPSPVKVSLDQPPAKPLSAVLLAAGEAHQVIQFNNQAALQKRIFADGFCPNSAEFQLTIGVTKYVAQRAENLGTGAVRVYYCPTTNYANVQFVERGQVADPPDPLSDALIAAGQARQVIQFNNQAALQKRIFADGFVPNSGEFQVTDTDGTTYVGQRAEHLVTGRVRIYYCPTTNYGLVKIIER